MKHDTTTIWVCENCMYAHAYGETLHDTDPTPLTKLEGLEVTQGIMEDDHNGWCGCERIDFSSASCDGCEQTLAGERHALTLWDKE